MGIIFDPESRFDSDPETDLSVCLLAQADKSQQQQFPLFFLNNVEIVRMSRMAAL